MTNIKITKAEQEYLLYILTVGFVINENLTEKEYKEEEKLLDSIIKKVTA